MKEEKKWRCEKFIDRLVQTLHGNLTLKLGNDSKHRLISQELV